MLFIWKKKTSGITDCKVTIHGTGKNWWNWNLSWGTWLIAKETGNSMHQVVSPLEVSIKHLTQAPNFEGKQSGFGGVSNPQSSFFLWLTAKGRLPTAQRMMHLNLTIQTDQCCQTPVTIYSSHAHGPPSWLRMCLIGRVSISDHPHCRATSIGWISSNVARIRRAFTVPF